MTRALIEAARLYDDQRFLSKSEMRIYENKKRRMKIVRRQKLLLALCISVIIFIALFIRNYIVLNAQNDLYIPEMKYYKIVLVHENDTLWQIAGDYYDRERYDGFKSYISEICSINGLENEDSIRSGENLVIPYYDVIR